MYSLQTSNSEDLLHYNARIVELQLMVFTAGRIQYVYWKILRTLRHSRRDCNGSDKLDNGDHDPSRAIGP